MKRFILVVMLIVAGSLVWAADATFRSIQNGEVTISRSTGIRAKARSRDEIEAGDTIITGPTATAELDLARSGRILVAPDTVFTIQDLVREGETATILTVAVGSVELFFPRKTERVVTIGSQTSVATVGGTPVTVYVAVDGTTRFEVPEGVPGGTANVAASFDDLIDGWTVALGAGQGVEVRPAGRPSNADVYDLSAQPASYSEWNDARHAAMLGDPMGALGLLMRDYNVIAGNIRDLEPLAQEARDEISEHLTTYALKADRDGAKVANEYYLKNISPAQTRLAGYNAEMRFNAITALLIRRHTLATLYLEMTSRYFATPDDPAYTTFRAEYDELMTRFEAEIVPHLEPTDAL